MSIIIIIIINIIIISNGPTTERFCTLVVRVLQLLVTDDGDDMFLLNVVSFKCYTTSHSTIRHSP
jgi:hypothetical protein